MTFKDHNNQYYCVALETGKTRKRNAMQIRKYVYAPLLL